MPRGGWLPAAMGRPAARGRRPGRAGRASPDGQAGPSGGQDRHGGPAVRRARRRRRRRPRCTRWWPAMVQPAAGPGRGPLPGDVQAGTVVAGSRPPRPCAASAAGTGNAPPTRQAQRDLDGWMVGGAGVGRPTFWTTARFGMIDPQLARRPLAGSGVALAYPMPLCCRPAAASCSWVRAPGWAGVRRRAGPGGPGPYRRTAPAWSGRPGAARSFDGVVDGIVGWFMHRAARLSSWRPWVPTASARCRPRQVWLGSGPGRRGPRHGEGLDGGVDVRRAMSWRACTAVSRAASTVGQVVAHGAGGRVGARW